MYLGNFLKRTSLVVVHGGVDRLLASPQWGEVPPHRTGCEAGEQVERCVENLSQKSPYDATAAHY
jgi:hypothetical protein